MSSENRPPPTENLYDFPSCARLRLGNGQRPTACSLPSVAEMQAFYEVLLSYGASNMVYTSLIDANQIGFDENAYDFEMLVGEDWNDEAVTPYYFFAEIS